jgi:3-deoxy-D-manno-octulosonic-acid transferase
MLFLYNIVITIANLLLQIIAVFVPKLNFCRWQKDFITLSDKIKPTDQTIWFHAASLGEYEQGLPIIERMKEEYEHKIIISFFSPRILKWRTKNAQRHPIFFVICR